MIDYERFQESMERAGFAAILTVDPRNSYYLAGYMDPETWLRDDQDLTTFFPVFCPPEKSFVVGASPRPEFPGESYLCEMVIDSRLEMLAEQLLARKLGQAVIGVDFDYAPVNVINRLRLLLPEVQFRSADVLLGRLRSVKTDHEVRYIAKAVAIAEGAFLDIKDTIKNGVSVASVMRDWGRAVIARGGYPTAGMPFDYITQSVMTVQDNFYDAETGLNRLPTKFVSGQTTRLDVCVCYMGYQSDQKIVLCVGEPRPAAEATYREHRVRQEYMQQTIRPGMTKRAVYEACVAEFDHLEEYAFWIHGVGLDAHEEPRIGTLLPSAVNFKEAITFELGQVLALEPSWLVEDLYVLKEDGFDRLCALPQQIYALG